MKKAKLQLIDAHGGRWSASAMRRVLKVTRQGYYQRASRPVSARDGRDFDADGPNRAWLADIAYVKTCRGRLYAAVVIGIWSRMAVGWAMGPRIDAALADGAPGMAITRRRPSSGLIHHSDHGSQRRSLLLGKAMREHGIRPSMGSVASPWDNAPTESFMGILKRERVHRKTFEAREQAQIEIFECIEAFCSRLRMHSAPGFMSPMGFEEKMAKGADVENAVKAA